MLFLIADALTGTSQHPGGQSDNNNIGQFPDNTINSYFI